MPLNPRNTPATLGRARSGIAAMEFALIAPMLFTMAGGMFDAAKAMILKQEVEETARLVAISATAASVNLTTKTTTLTDVAAQKAMSIIDATMPWVRSGVEKGVKSVTLTSIAFRLKPSCTVTTSDNCYTAEVAFSVAYNGQVPSGSPTFVQTVRPCGGAIKQITKNATIVAPDTDFTILRTAGVGKPDALMVADVDYKYTPTAIFSILHFFPNSFTFHATSAWPARSASGGTQGYDDSFQYTDYSGSGGTGNCSNL